MVFAPTTLWIHGGRVVGKSPLGVMASCPSFGINDFAFTLAVFDARLYIRVRRIDEPA